jgi:hypothetical protein
MDMGFANSAIFWKRVAVALLVSWVTAGLLWFSLWESYIRTKPREVQRNSGRVVPLISYGVVVYLTNDERDRLTFLNYAVYVFTISFGLVQLVKKPFGASAKN